MKILLINDHASPIGGAEVLTLALRAELRRRGHDARLFTSNAYQAPHCVTDSEAAADYRCFGTDSPRLQMLLQPLNPSAFWKLRRALRDFQPDVVHVRMFLMQLSPSIMPLLRDVPSLYHVVTYKAICPLSTKMLPDGAACQSPAGVVCYRNRCLSAQAWLPTISQLKLWRRWRDAFDVIVANSQAVRQRLLADGIAPVEVILNGVPERSSRPPLESPPTVFFAGRLAREKGVDTLIRAFAETVARLPQARLLIAGDGLEREQLLRLIGTYNLGDRVSLLGHLSRIELERRASAAWVQAVPSRWEEPFGLAAAEAMMRGTAVVASDCGGLAEIVRHDETGLLVPPNDPGALAQALLRLLSDRELAERMGQAARARALQHFSQAAFVDKFVRLYETLVSNA